MSAQDLGARSGSDVFLQQPVARTSARAVLTTRVPTRPGCLPAPVENLHRPAAAGRRPISGRARPPSRARSGYRVGVRVAGSDGASVRVAVRRRGLRASRQKESRRTLLMPWVMYSSTSRRVTRLRGRSSARTILMERRSETSPDCFLAPGARPAARRLPHGEGERLMGPLCRG